MSTEIASLPSIATSRRNQSWELFTILMLLIMELNWIVPTYSLLIGYSVGSSVLRAFMLFGAIYLSSYIIASAPKYFEVVLGLIQLFLLTLLLVGVVWAASELIYFNEQLSIGATISRYFGQVIRFSFPLKPELLLLITIFLLWRRGFSIANHSVGPGLIRRSFRMGSFVLVGIGAFAALFSYRFPFFEASLFLLTGLLAMGGARFASLGTMRGSKRVAFKREWVLGLAIMASIVVALSVSFALFAAGLLSSWIGDALRAADRYLSDVLELLLAPLINFLGIIFAWFWSLFEAPPEQDPTAVDALEEGLEGPVAQIQQFATDPEFAALLSTLGTVLGVLLILAIIYYAVRRFRRDSKPHMLDGEDAISIAGSLSDYLRGIQDRARQMLNGVSRMNPAARLIAAARIRIVYAQLLRLAARLGEPRPPAMTPIEYLSNLDNVFPASRDELECITDAYLRVRYGELPETREQIEQIEAAWDIVRRQGRAV